MIYFLQFGDGGPIKIGYSKNPRERLKTLRNMLRFSKITHGSIDQEQKLHRHFRSLHVQGEWFKPTKELTDFIAQLSSARRSLIPSDYNLKSSPLGSIRPRQIKSRLKELGITQIDLCRRWGIAPVTISYLVNRKMTSANLQKKLARLLGVSVDEVRMPNGARR